MRFFSLDYKWVFLHVVVMFQVHICEKKYMTNADKTTEAYEKLNFCNGVFCFAVGNRKFSERDRIS